MYVSAADASTLQLRQFRIRLKKTGTKVHTSHAEICLRPPHCAHIS